MRDLDFKIAAQAAGLDTTAVTRVVQVQDNVGAVRVLSGTRWALPDGPVSESAERTLHLSAESIHAYGRRFRLGLHNGTLYVSEETR
jgi:hypothetical protein